MRLRGVHEELAASDESAEDRHDLQVQRQQTIRIARSGEGEHREEQRVHREILQTPSAVSRGSPFHR